MTPSITYVLKLELLFDLYITAATLQRKYKQCYMNSVFFVVVFSWKLIIASSSVYELFMNELHLNFDSVAINVNYGPDT